jgi:hypothetical protein
MPPFVARICAIVALPVTASITGVLNWAMSKSLGTTPNCQLAGLLKSNVPFDGQIR